jgi:hypothetical protein
MNTTDSRFRELDPSRALTDEQLDPRGDRARAMLAEITATDRVARPVPVRDEAPARRRPRLLPAAGIASALLVGAVVGPAAVGLDSASAQWVAMPTGVPVADAVASARSCRELLTVADGMPGTPAPGVVGRMPVVVAEDRGSWRFVVLSDGRWEASCLQQRSTLDRIVAALGGGDSFSGGGGLTQLDELPKPAAREVRTVDVMGSTVSGTLRAASSVSSITGRVGAEVVGVVVAPVGHPKVTATVANGWFAAWWPVPGPGAGGVAPTSVALTVTLRGGTTVDFPVGSEQATPMAGSGTTS